MITPRTLIITRSDLDPVRSKESFDSVELNYIHSAILKTTSSEEIIIFLDEDGSMKLLKNKYSGLQTLAIVKQRANDQQTIVEDQLFMLNLLELTPYQRFKQSKKILIQRLKTLVSNV